MVAASPQMFRRPPPMIDVFVRRLLTYHGLQAERVSLLNRFLDGESSPPYIEEIREMFRTRSGGESGLSLASSWAILAVVSHLTGNRDQRDAAIRWSATALDEYDQEEVTLEMSAPVWGEGFMPGDGS